MKTSLIRAYALKMTSERGTPVGDAEAEEEIVRVIRRVARSVSRHFRYGYHTEEDMEGQGVVYALEVLGATRRDGSPAYDVARPLENFLHVHIKNRLMNEKRKHFTRAERPCSCCEAFGSPRDPCKRWVDWNARNASKQNLMRPLDVSSVRDDGERNMSVASRVADDVAAGEVLDLIDRGLPAEIRADYLRMRGGVSVPKGRRQKVREAVLEIIGDSAFGGDE